MAGPSGLKLGSPDSNRDLKTAPKAGVFPLDHSPVAHTTGYAMGRAARTGVAESSFG